MAGALIPAIAYAQIRTDGTLGAAQVLTGPNFAIPASLGRQAGANLFHSFAQFGVPTGGSATFSGPSSVGNIISRVTGADLSSIDGTLRSTIPGANLFLVNPKGIVFGPGARLDITGSFYASTANYLRMADGTRFEATGATPAVLSMAPPAAFGFFGPAAPITVQGSDLRAAPEKALALVGGPLTIDAAGIRTFSGDLGLAAIASAGEVGVDPALTPSAGMTLAPVNIAGGAAVRANDNTVLAPGRLVIRGGQITAVNSTVASQNPGAFDAPPIDLLAAGDITLSNMQVLAVHAAGGRGADIRVTGDNVLLDRFTRVTVGATAGRTPTGRYGDIEISARGALRIASVSADPGFTLVRNSTSSPGEGGAIRLSGDVVVVDGAQVVTRGTRTGGAGPLEVAAREIDLPNGAFLSSVAQGGGRGGDIRLVASGTVSLSGVDPAGFGTFIQSSAAGGSPGGAISVHADSIDIAGGAVTSIAFSGGSSGGVTLDARTIRIRDEDGRTSGVLATSESTGAGMSGDVLVRARESITVEGWGRPPGTPANVGLLEDGSGIRTFSPGSGPAGNVTVEAPRILLQRGGGISSESSGSGPAGSVIVRGHEIDLRGAAGIESIQVAGASGRTGNIRIEGTGTLSIGTAPAAPPPPGGRAPPDLTSGFILAETSGTANAGGIRIDMPEVMLGPNSFIITSQPANATGGVAGSGDLTINARRIVADHAVLGAPTTGSGRGGSVRIRAEDLVLRNSDIVSGPGIGASGQGGSILVELTGRLDISGVLDPLTGRGSGITAGTQGTGRAGDALVRAGSIVIDGGFISASTDSAGAAGSVHVQAGTIDLVNGGAIRAAAFQGSTGAGGSVTVSATGAIRLRGVTASSTDLGGNPGGTPRPSAITSSTEGAGGAGDVQVEAPRVLIADGAEISSRSTTSGPAGSVRVVATDALEIFGGGAISTEALLSDGGNIDIRAGNRVHLRNSEISTSVGSGQGAGGNIFIDPTFVILENSRIVANAFGGPGGNIRIIADYFLSSPGSLVDASSRLGVSGSVQIAALNTDLDSELAALPTQVLDASAMLRESCTTRFASERGSSSLVGVGRGGLAASPERFAAASYFWSEGAPDATAAEVPSSTGSKLVATRRARQIARCGNG